MLFALKLPPGLFLNGTKLQAAGRWFQANLIRFAEGCVRPLGGWQVLTASAQTDDIIYSDLFTDTNGTALNSHSPTSSPTAFTWGAGPASIGTSAFTIQSNAVSCTTDDATGTHQTSAQVVTPDYTVSLSVFVPTGATSSSTLGVSARHASGGAGGYWVVLRGDGSLVLTERAADGSVTQTDTDVAPLGFVQNASYTLTLRCEGSTITASYTATGTATATLTSSTWSGRYAGVWGSPKRTGLTAMSGDSFAVTLLGTVNVNGVPRSVLGWRGNDGSSSIGIGTNTKWYAHWLGSLYDITPSGFTAGTVDAAAGVGEYGEGVYGSGPYGVSDPAQATLDPPAVWHQDNWGDYLVGCCSPNDGKLYYWDRTATTIGVVMTNAPTGCTGLVVTPERFMVALGASGGARTIAWASQESLTDWTPTSTNTAGDFVLEGKGSIVAARRAKSETLIWTTDELYAMRYIGGTLIYAFERMGSGCGLIAPGAVAQPDVQTLWMGMRGFFLYDGYVKALDSEVSDYVFSDFNRTQAGKVTAYTTAEYGEVTWHYPSGSSTENDRYVTYNYRENHWTVGELDRTAGCDAGALEYPVKAASTGVLYEHEKTFSHLDTDGTALVPYAESGPVQLGDGERVLQVSQLIPDEQNPVGTLGVNLGNVALSLYTSFYPGEAEVLHGPFTIRKLTDARFTGRWVRAVLTEEVEGDWRFGVLRVDGQPGGFR